MGAKPVGQQLKYDDLNQLRQVDFAYSTTSKDDTQVSPFAADAKAGDPRPIPEQPMASRLRSQTFDFDWQGNLTKSDDDTHAFFDRSMGTISHGTPSSGPNRATGASGANGHATASYDAAGNLTGLEVTKPGPDGTALDIQFTYEWDEVGRMVRATRKPIAGLSSDKGVDFYYAYDANGRRVRKSVVDPRTQDRRYSLEVLPTLRLNMAAFQDGDYQRTPDTETVYLVSNGATLGRVVYDTSPDHRLPSLDGSRQHVFFMISDRLGSTSLVIDKATSELVERISYQAYGATESDYRPERWRSFREDYRFTGKEDDVGVGLTYFGARYYVPALGQWASADPEAVQHLGSDLNPYAYALGSPRKVTDPTGLAECEKNCPVSEGEGISSGGLSGDYLAREGALCPACTNAGGRFYIDVGKGMTPPCLMAAEQRPRPSRIKPPRAKPPRARCGRPQGPLGMARAAPMPAAIVLI